MSDTGDKKGTMPDVPDAGALKNTEVVVFPLVSGALVLASVTVFLAVLIGLILGFGMGWWDQATLSTMGALISLVGGLVGLLPVWRLSRESMQAGAMGFMAGIVIRLVICGAAVLVARGMLESSTQARFFSFWVAGWYLALLAIEVKLLSSYLSRASTAEANARRMKAAQEVNTSAKTEAEKNDASAQ